MVSDESEHPELSNEGVHTLAAQVTRKEVDRIVAVIKRERQRGATEKSLAKALEKNLSDFDAHTRGLLLKLGFEKEIPDNFPPAIVTASEQVKSNTIELTVSQFPAELSLFSLVRHKGKEWLITESKGNKCTLKELK